MKEFMLSPDKMEAENHWDDIGIQLEIDDGILENISERNPFYGSRESFKAMVRAWVKQKNPQPSTFIEALECLNICKNLSAHLRSKYCKYV
jgi:hypothetical protein